MRLMCAGSLFSSEAVTVPGIRQSATIPSAMTRLSRYALFPALALSLGVPLPPDAVLAAPRSAAPTAKAPAAKGKAASAPAASPLAGPALEADLAALLADRTAAKRYPDAAVEHLLEDRRVVVGADGTYTETIRDVTRVLNKRGQEGWSEGSEGYDYTHQTLNLDWARTILPDGTVHPVAPNALKDASPFADYPSYDRYRVKTWTFPATSPGAVLDYRATLTARRPMLERDFADFNYLADFQPARLVRYTVSMPKDKPLYHLLRQPRPDVKVEFEKVAVAADRVEYRWVVRNVGYTLPESNMPPSAEVVPSILVTTQPSWEAVAHWWRKVNATKGKPSPAVEALARKLTAGLTDPREKAKTIYEWVVKNIRYVYVDMAYTGYESQSADDVLRSQYGDCKGGSTLLMALLQAAGVPAHHALIRTASRGKVVKDSPSVYQFNHCIVAAELPGGLLFLDNVGKTVRFGTLPTMDQGTTALVVTPDGHRFVDVPLASPEVNAVTTRRVIEMDPTGGATVSVVQTYSGLQDSSNRADYQSLSPTRTRQAFESRVSDEVPNARLLDYNVTDPEDLGTPLEVRFSYAAPNFADRAGDLMIFRVPGYAPDMSSFERAERRFPLWSEALLAFGQDVEIKLPPGYRIRHIPGREEVMLDHVSFAGAYEAVGGSIRFSALTRYLSREVAPADYPSVRDLMRRRALFGKGLVVIEAEK